MFTTEDIWAIIKWLSIPATDDQALIIRAALATLEARSPTFVIDIQADIAALVELDNQMQKQMGVIKADVLEFDAKQRLMGAITRSIQLVRRIAKNISAGAGTTISPDLSGLQEMYNAINFLKNEPLTIGKEVSY
jgi:hypothetical protein